VDGTRTRSAGQKDQGQIAYVQNAEQENVNAIWKRLKGLE
jgi:hypothetical protein